MISGGACRILCAALVGSIVAYVTKIPPAVAEDLHARALHRAPYVIGDACALIEMLRMQKVDGQWIGGRSLWRAELPVAGPGAEFLTKYYGFADAVTFRHYLTQFKIAADHWDVSATLDPDSLGADRLLAEIDRALNQLLEGFGEDPWQLCGEEP